MRLIDSEEQSRTLVKALEHDLRDSPKLEQFIAVDTEFIRENLAKPLLCLVQLATGKETYVLDAISIAVSVLNPIFEDKKIKKVFYSASQDLEILSIYGLNIKNFYDVQLYEMILSTNEMVGYQSIVLKYLGKKLKKGYALSDWGKRPLNAEQLNYSVEDVTHLREVYKKQIGELTALDRLHWLDEEEHQLLMSSKTEAETTVNFLSEKSANVFRQLITWRNQKAKEENLLPEQIARDSVVKDICRRGMELVQNMKNARHVKNARFKEFLTFAETIPELGEVSEKRVARNPTLTLLRALLEMCSEQKKISPSMIATTKELERLCYSCGGDIDHSDLRCLNGWRYDVFGRHAVALLVGEIALSVRDSSLEIQ
ncbi:MAG: HRDC domain-containing protein [Holosporaceae bacterium]|jgi:ribonuclease D|nr:HRDC domain-containing protein [Holosporaceae bacterium]